MRPPVASTAKLAGEPRPGQTFGSLVTMISQRMSRRPSYRRRIKRGQIVPWPDDAGSPEEIAGVVTYTGNPVHKTYPVLGVPPAWRADKAKCDRFAESEWEKMRDALRQAIRGGYVSEFRGGFPERVWAWVNGVLHEARLTNERTGDYHGFPINDPRQYPLPAALLENAPRVEISVV